MKIEVTKAHVEQAVQRDSHHCMIADAIRDQTKAKYILVDVQSIRWSNLRTGKRYTYLTPMVAQQAIIAFDRGERMAPFTFHLQAPVTTRAIRHVRTGDPTKVAKTRKAYEHRAKQRGKRKSANVGHATREREYGVRKLVA